MGRITGRLLLLLWLCAIPSFALSPTPGSLDSQAAIEIQAQVRAERETLGLPKNSSNDLVSGLEFVHSPQYTGSDESWVRCDEWGSSPHDDAVIWQKTVQVTPQWFSPESALPRDPALDRGFGTYASQSYTGREWDEETGLYQYRFRDYEPNAGRFIQEDAFGGIGQVPATQHLYAYVGNNPVNFADPAGLAYAVFDGDRFTIYHDTGEIWGSWPAHSGTPPYGEGMPDAGPIPSGGSVDISNRTRCGSGGECPRVAGGYRIFATQGTFTSFHRRIYGSWGIWNVPLFPAAGTKTHGRGTSKTGLFFLHSGTHRTTWGCIRIPGEKNILEAKGILEEAFDKTHRPMGLIVKYK